MLKQLTKRRHWPNTMFFPSELQQAIPNLPSCSGRVLELDAIHGEPVSTEWFGERVQVKLRVQETGKLTGKYDVLLDLQPEAARALAATLTELADRLEE